MRPRFHVPDLDPAAELAVLPDDEAAHLGRVLRLGAGAAVDVMDGRGGLWLAEVVTADKRSATVRLLRPCRAAPEVGVSITLVPSVLKGDKFDDVVRDAVMLGVHAIQPIVSARSEVGLKSSTLASRSARWHRISVASAKQCGRAVVPEVRPPVSWDAYLQQPAPGVRVLCVEPSSSDPAARSVQNVARPLEAHLMVGPEGGWSSEEIDAAIAAGAVPVSLGRLTLRADAAPIVALVALLTTWGEF